MLQQPLDVPALTHAWRAAQPFPHVVIDDFLTAEAIEDVFERVDEEGVEHFAADLYSFDATPPEPRSDGMRELRSAWAAQLAGPLAQVTGKALSTTDLRAYAYRVGHYLLPHADHQAGLARQLAYAYYLPSPEPPSGGELELYACRSERGELVDIASAKVIEAVANRIVIFEVSDVSLHQVREVLGGLRMSLSGWFYP